jgi:hypothetical protein
MRRIPGTVLIAVGGTCADLAGPIAVCRPPLSGSSNAAQDDRYRRDEGNNPLPRREHKSVPDLHALARLLGMLRSEYGKRPERPRSEGV